MVIDLSSHISKPNDSISSEIEVEESGGEKMGGVSNVILRDILPD